MAEKINNIKTEFLQSMVQQMASIYKTAQNALNIANTASNTLSTLKSKLDRYPDLSSVISNGNTYGLRNGALEIVAGNGEEVLVQTAATAQSLALQSLEQGVLVLDGADEQMAEEIRDILGEELFDELATKNVQTMELHPEPSFEQMLTQAKEAYYERKADQERMALAMVDKLSEAESAEATEIGSSDVVKPKKG